MTQRNSVVNDKLMDGQIRGYLKTNYQKSLPKSLVYTNQNTNQLCVI